MRAFVCEVGNQGLHQFVPEYLLSPDELARLAHVPSQPSCTIVWALLGEPDAEAVRTEIGFGRSRDAYDLLLNRTVEILPIAVPVPDTASKSLPSQ